MIHKATVAFFAAAGLATAVAGADSLPGRIAWVDNDGGLVVAGPDGSGKKNLGSVSPVQPASFRPVIDAEAGFYSWPTWSPDARRILAFHVAVREDGLLNGLYVLDASTGRVLATYRHPDLRPIYAYWSPDGERAGVLLEENRSFSLALWSAAGSPPRGVASGAPFFFDWRRDSQSLLLHIGRDPRENDAHTVSLLDLEGSARTVLSRSAAFYGPASFAPDGKRLAYGALEDTTNGRLEVASGEGKNRRLVATVPPNMGFLWSPSGDRLALATARSPDPSSAFDELRVLRMPSGEGTVIARDRIDAFFWAPTGERILYARRNEDAGDWSWVVVDLPDGESREIARFLPSRPALMLGRFFDQYALSHRLWSPDGRAFVFTGAWGDGPEAVDPIGAPRIYVAPVDGSGPPRMIAEGHTAFWSPE